MKLPALEIMNITGYKTKEALVKYTTVLSKVPLFLVEVSKLDIAKRLNQHMKKRHEEKKQKAILRVA